MTLLGKHSVRATKLRAYRGYTIRIHRDGTWCEAGIYRKDGSLDQHLAATSVTGSGHGTYETIFRKGERVIDAMRGD